VLKVLKVLKVPQELRELRELRELKELKVQMAPQEHKVQQVWNLTLQGVKELRVYKVCKVISVHKEA